MTVQEEDKSYRNDEYWVDQHPPSECSNCRRNGTLQRINVDSDVTSPYDLRCKACDKYWFYW